MNDPAWQLEGTIARLNRGRWRASIDLAQPERGIALQTGGDTQTSRLQILGVTFGEAQPIPAARIDAYVRGRDLVATYEEQPPRCVRAQAYWREISPNEFCERQADPVALAFELIVSVNTSLLDSDPQAGVCSAIAPPANVLEIARGNLLARPADEAFSYVEMVHPAELEGEGSSIETTPQGVRIRYQLFKRRLEKGVILRARLRAGIVQRQHDEAAAVAAYKTFEAVEPPLTV